MRQASRAMASRTIIGSSVKLWALIRPGIKEGQRGKIHCRVPPPLERGFRRLQTVGFSLDTAEAILLTTTLHISGLNPAACLLAPSSFVRPLLGWHVEFASDLLARR